MAYRHDYQCEHKEWDGGEWVPCSRYATDTFAGSVFCAKHYAENVKSGIVR